MLSPATLALLSPLAIVLALLVYAALRYTPIIARILEEMPVFLPVRLPAEPGGEEVRFTTSDGLELAGIYLPARTATRAGVLVFCHEFLSDRWSYQSYVGELRDLGFDLFSFDFRNHGDSAADASYQPLQWVTEREVRDLDAALAYLRSRPDRDPAGFGLFGVSRGGGSALCAAAKAPDVWGVITDGAFPTRGTMWSYMHRWAEIYVTSRSVWRRIPPEAFVVVVAVVGWTGRLYSQWRRGCRFLDLERAVGRLAPRPWLMIHGEKDTYIGPAIARALFARAGEPKQIWIVPKARHNRCREVDLGAYRARIVEFLDQFGPRRLSLAPAASAVVAQSGSPANGVELSVTAPAPGPVAAAAPMLPAAPRGVAAQATR